MKVVDLPRQPFVGLALAAAIGVALADFFPIAPTHWMLGAALFVVLGLATLFWPKLGATYSLVGFGFFLLHLFQTQDTPGLRLAAQLGERPRAINVIGFAIDEPKLGVNGFSTFLFKLESAEFEGRTAPATATLYVRWRGQPAFGDKLKLFGFAEPVPPPRNPGEFDMRSYLARLDVHRRLFVRYAEDGSVIQRGTGNPILRAAQVSRGWMQRVLCRSLDDSPDVQNFISGIVLGLRHQTVDDIEEPFQQTGTLHLFAVAGLHVGIVARLLWIVAIVARLSQKQAAAVIIPLLLFYAAITGLHVSSVRAAVMSSVLLGGLFFERKVFALNSLAAAAFFLLCWNTNELFATGFQLSFAVVGTIVLMADPVFRLCNRVAATDPFLPASLLSRARRIFNSAFESLCRGSSVSLAAWLGSLLLVFWYFHLVTPVSLIANLVVVPIAFFILATALLSIATAPVLGSFSVVFNNSNWFFARGVLAIVHWFAQIPGNHYYVPLPQLVGNVQCKITVLDLGAGGAIHVRARGADWLFDCGSERDYSRILREYLHVAGVNQLHGLLLSHGDSLHIGGAKPLLQDFPPRLLIDNPTADRSIVHRRLRHSIIERAIAISNLSSGANFEVARDVAAKILFPPPQVAVTTADDEAFVVQLSIGSAPKILLMSDSGYRTEEWLLKSGANLQSDILVKGQHHSGKSGSAQFLEAVHPKLIVAASRDFPASERIEDQWAEQIQARGIKLFRQDETGAVELFFHDRDWEARSYLTSETFRNANR
jgi:competence protein ComEC